mgnify:CR=1 FL=1
MDARHTEYSGGVHDEINDLAAHMNSTGYHNGTASPEDTEHIDNKLMSLASEVSRSRVTDPQEAMKILTTDKNGKLKAAGLYVNELKDSTWNYFNTDSVLVMSEQYVKGELNGLTKTYHSEGEIYEVKSWVNNVADGKLVQYFMDGSIKMESAFVMGKREGKEFFFSSADKNHC